MARTANTKVIFVPMNLGGFDSGATTHPNNQAMTASVARDHPELQLGNQAQGGTDFVSEDFSSGLGSIGKSATILNAASGM